VGNSPDRIFYKAKNGADQNPNYPIGTVEDIAERVKNLKDLLGRTSRFNQLRIIDINDDKPASMDKFLKKYPEFFYREKS
jgi:hypothetical protein